MKKTAMIVLGVVALTGCATISKEECAKNRNVTICVLPFRRDNKYNVAFRVMKDYKSRCYRIVERNRLERILSEQRKQFSENFDTVTAVQLGKLIGAQYIIYGNVYTKPHEMYTAVFVNYTMINVQTGEVEKIVTDHLIMEAYKR